MTQQEFTQRVGMQVNADEYRAIEQVYMASDVDKDEFCKLWVRMNAQRVNAAKERAKQQEQDKKLREQLWCIVMQFGGMSFEVYQQEASAVLTVKQRKLVRRVGIQLELCGSISKSLSAVIYEIKKYLKAA